MFIDLKNTAKWLSYKSTLESRWIFRWRCWWDARCFAEGVDKFEDEESWKCAAEIRNAVIMVRSVVGSGKIVNLRSKQGHISPSNSRIRNLRMECTDGNKHDCAHECAEDVLHDDKQQIGDRSPASWEQHDCYLSKHGSNKPTDECPAPNRYGFVLF